MYDAAAASSCSFGGQDLSTHGGRRAPLQCSPGLTSPSTANASVPSATLSCSVQVKVEECGPAADEWAGCAYRFASQHHHLHHHHHHPIGTGGGSGALVSRRYTADDSKGTSVMDVANKVLDGGVNSALAATFRNRYLGASAFSNIPTAPHLFPGPYVTDIASGKTADGTTLLTSSSTGQSGNGGDALSTRSPVNSSSSSSNRNNHPTDSGVPKAKRVVVPADPLLWNTEHVKQWLDWAVKEYNLHDVDASRFNVIGRELCQLTREDYSRLTNPYNGEVLYAHLSFLRQTSEASLPPASREKPPISAQTGSPSLVTEPAYKGAWGTPSPTQAQGYPHNAIGGMTKTTLEAHTHPHIRNMQDPYQMFGPTSSRLASSGSGQIQLWQFLLELLSDSSNANCITWEGTNGEFKLTDPDEVARRWGERKSKPNMNYDKLSRALRYYYDKNIMTKVHGKRYAYKFDFQGLAQATQPTAADPTAYKYQSDLFMSGYHHSPKLNFAVGAHTGIPSTTGSIFPAPTSYWTNPSANLYTNIAAASTHSMPHHPGHVTPHIGSYPHYA